MTIIEILAGSFYGVSGFATFLRGVFSRQLAISRAKSDPNEAEKAVHSALWEVRTTFEGLFKDNNARKNALNLFPTMRDLPESVTEQKPVAMVSYPRLVGDAVFWPVMVPVNVSRKIAANIAASELADAQAKQESFNILADHEDYAPLAEAFRSGDDDRIQRAIIDKSVWQDKQAELARTSPQLVLDKPEPDWGDMALRYKERGIIDN